MGRGRLCTCGFPRWNSKCSDCREQERKRDQCPKCEGSGELGGRTWIPHEGWSLGCDGSSGHSTYDKPVKCDKCKGSGKR